MQKVWVELPELVELKWSKDLEWVCYHKQINTYQGIFITFTADKVIVEAPYVTVQEFREEDLVGQIEKMLDVEVYWKG